MAPKRRQKAQAAVPDVYEEMLVEAKPVHASPDEGRSAKRRRVGGKLVVEEKKDAPPVKAVSSTASNRDANGRLDHDDLDDLFEDVDIASRQQQILLSESEDSADSDIDWENVDLKPEPQDVELAEDDISGEAPDEPKELNLVLDRGEQERDNDRPKRKAVTALEKKLRLEIHKLNICCLMAHVHVRNHWCNDEKIQTILRRHVTKRTVSYLNPDESLSQFQQSRSFMDGLSQISEIFRSAFRKTARGMAKPQWSLPDQDASVPDDIELPMEKEDFADAARDMAGCRDTGAQLFCCMLRAVGVDARLVCSLQPFQFRAVEKAATPQKQYAAYVAHASRRQETPEREVGVTADDDTPSQKPRQNGRPDKTTAKVSPAIPQLVNRPKTPNRPIRESRYPIYWTEAFNSAVQKWVPLDPLVTQTIAKPSKFEPPLGERENDLSYVLAFEDDLSARDVTRRYAKAYNAKTRRDRVESTKGGQRWWKRVMKVFRRHGGFAFDRDQVEDAELAANEAAEPMPRNVIDFKDHPYYALERHLRRHEVIHPKREVGKVGATGKGHDSKSLELIYRRRDVQQVQSVDKWFRMGREVRAGEQALKHVTPSRKQRALSVEDDDEEMTDSERAGTPLFSIHQTTLYRPQPITNGTVPRNQYNNLDIYVPSMIPSGGAHIQHPSASRAAKVLGISYADAVTGFKFSGRHGTAVINGAVVAAECVDAVREVITAVEDERAVLEGEKRAAAAMALWRKFLVGLRVRKRIEGYDVEGEDGEEKPALSVSEAKEEESEEDEGGGGFFPDPDAPMDLEPAVVTRTKPLEDDADGYNTGISTIERPPPIIPVVYGPPISSSTSGPPPFPQVDLFGDEGGGENTRQSTAEPEAEAIQLAIARSLTDPVLADFAQQAAGEGSGKVYGNELPDAAAPMTADVSVDGELNKVHLDAAQGKTTNRLNDSEKLAKDRGEEEEGSNSSDAGSLLSHDPEDEEAEDWPSSPANSSTY